VHAAGEPGLVLTLGYNTAVFCALYRLKGLKNVINMDGVVQALRFHARFYVHGRQVGGTNPSLVEALGAGNAVLAHDNRYNRWVAGDAGVYFANEAECALAIERLLAGGEELAVLQNAARARHSAAFTWDGVLGEYEALLAGWA
jgi:glycosyltransferase involved in cell wall biosynthesis